MNPEAGRKAIQTHVREFRLFAENESEYTLEIELITGEKTRTSTIDSEGSKDRVGKPLIYTVIQFSQEEKVLTISLFHLADCFPHAQLGVCIIAECGESIAQGYNQL